MAQHRLDTNMEEFKRCPLCDNTRYMWCQVLHDFIPTNARLHRMKMTRSNSCQRCTMADTLEHRLTECGVGWWIWQNTLTRIALILRTTQSLIPDEWILRPHFNICPSKRNNAILWMTPNVVIFRIQQRTTLTLHDLMHFLLRTRWKLLNHKRGRNLFGSYLTVID